MRYQVVLVCFVAALLAGCAAATEATPTPVSAGPAPGSTVATSSKILDSNAPTLPDVGQTAPDFEYTLADGTTHKLSDLRGTKVVINFWATWCTPCLDEMPEFDRVQQEYGDDLVVLGVNKAEKLWRVEGFTHDLLVRFPLVTNAEGDIAERYQIVNVPMSFFINSDGTIGVRELGIMDYNKIQANIALLQ